MSETKKEYSPQISEAMMGADQFKDDLVGRKIIQIRRMTEDEMEHFGWYSNPIIIRLDNGAAIIPMRDDEGNDGGSMEFIDWEGNAKTLFTR